MDESPFLSCSYSSSFGCLGDYQRWRRKSWNAIRTSAVKITSPILSIHSSFSLWPSFIPTSCEWVTAAREYKGTGSVEEAEWRQQSKTGPWRLDVRGMLLSKLYHSVIQQDQSPQTAPKLLLFFFFCAPSVSWCLLFILTLCLRYCDHTSHLVRYWTGSSNLRCPPCPSVLEFVAFFYSSINFWSIVYFSADSSCFILRFSFCIDIHMLNTFLLNSFAAVSACTTSLDGHGCKLLLDWLVDA